VQEAKDGFAKYVFSVYDETDGKWHPGFDVSEREDEEQAREGDSDAGFGEHCPRKRSRSRAAETSSST
jgi:hypothetical protein